MILEAWGPTIVACLEEAATALCEIFAAPADPTGRTAFSLVDVDHAELLPRFLEEIVYVLDTADGIPIGAIVDEVDGVVAGSILLADRGSVELIGPGPKAVSRSGAALAETPSGWRCRATIDV